MNVYIGTSGTLKNAYIGEWKPFTPTSNTLFYYPFVDNQLDVIGNTSVPITGTKQTVGYQFSFNSNHTYLTTDITNTPFVSFWIKPIQSTGSYSQTACSAGYIHYNFYHSGANHKFEAAYFASGSSSYSYISSSTQNATFGNWYHFAYGVSGNNLVAYINGELVWSATQSNLVTRGPDIGRGMIAIMSEFIGENRVWTAQEVQDYYNQTKSKYGL